VASSGTPVTVGLELPVENQERVRRFIASAGTEQDHALLMESPFWRSPYPDGRGSEAVAHLLEQLRWLRAQGLDVRVFVFDHPELQGEAREAAMAQSILSEMAPERFALVVTGNIHPRINPGVPWDLGYRPMGYLLSRKLPSVLSLDVAFDSGTAWICAVDEKKALECGVQETKGRDNGDRPFVFTFDKPSEAGYHGIFYVGPVSASPPAVRPGSPHPM
jgi:hypothetical protein